MRKERELERKKLGLPPLSADDELEIDQEKQSSEEEEEDTPVVVKRLKVSHEESKVILKTPFP